MMPNKITSLDAVMTLVFNIEYHWRGGASQ